MFPIAYAPSFNEAHIDITRNLHFLYDDYNALGEFDNALQCALATVRLFPEAYPRTGKARRRFTFEYRSILYTVLYTFDGKLVMLHDIHFSRSARTAHWLAE